MDRYYRAALWGIYERPTLLNHAELLTECERLLTLKHARKERLRLEALTEAVKNGYTFTGKLISRRWVLLESKIYDKCGRERLFEFPCGHLITFRERSTRPEKCGVCRGLAARKQAG
ncbi:MAG: hypothetical protein E7E23_02245 [Paenibacillus sp.]|uniref:hypothetical protein n=1 Tax=Paenibacillus sp. TaxID=58172 RepID=UPI00290391FC|nr:hypothetical protein [Paenibacillus sp.]MDU2239371.1 hypothetical protein [Paenibacillus sp.]